MSNKQCDLCLGFDAAIAEVVGLKACTCDTQPIDKLPQDVESWIASRTLQTGYQAAEPVVMVTPKEMRLFLASLQPKQVPDEVIEAMRFAALKLRGAVSAGRDDALAANRIEKAIAALGSKSTVGTIGHVHPSKAGLAESMARAIAVPQARQEPGKNAELIKRLMNVRDGISNTRAIIIQDMSGEVTIENIRKTMVMAIAALQEEKEQ